MERLQIELDELKVDYDELNDRHTGLQENNEDLRDKHDDLKGGIKKLQKELDEHKAENARLRLKDCKTILEEDGIVAPDQPSFIEEVEEELEEEIEEPLEEVEEVPKDLDTGDVEVVEEN